MAEAQFRRIRALKGAIRVPGDKSISHRAVIMATLGEGETHLSNFLVSGTTGATVDCLTAMGAEIRQPTSADLLVRGHGLRSLREPAGTLHCAGSGTTMRLLAGVCAGNEFLTVLDGTDALRRRPMGRVVEPLRKMGATILAREKGRLAPLAIQGGHLHGTNQVLSVASAQVKSAIVLAALFADGPTTVSEPAASRDHTERMLGMAGATVKRTGTGTVQLDPPARLSFPATCNIPSDFSSAAFFLTAATLLSGSHLHIDSVGINPTRTGLVDVLTAMGGSIEIEDRRDELGEPVADLCIRGVEGLRPADIRGELIPRMIDEFPILAVAATQAHGITVVRDAQELRAKESDRIDSLVQELRKMGAEIEPREDGLNIAGPVDLHGARVSAHGDHRLAMSLAVAGLVASGETVVEGWECVDDSFPGFRQVLAAAQGES